MLEDVAVVFSVTALSGVVPSLTRSTRALRESPASIIPPENGTDAPAGELTSTETTPSATWGLTGLVLSVNWPNVPRPATATAAPTALSAPTIVSPVRRRVVIVLSMAVTVVPPRASCRAAVLPGDVPTLHRVPQAAREETARDLQVAGSSDRAG